MIEAITKQVIEALKKYLLMGMIRPIPKRFWQQPMLQEALKWVIHLAQALKS